MNETTPLPPPDIDRMLRAYFRSEMPDPWPRLLLAEPARLSWWRRYGARLAVAASVALLLTGYLALAGHFPREAVPSQAIDLNGPNIGDRPSHHRPTTVRPTPSTEEPVDGPEWSLNLNSGPPAKGPR